MLGLLIVTGDQDDFGAAITIIEGPRIKGIAHN